MFDFFSADKGKKPLLQPQPQTYWPGYDFKIGPFKIGSTSSTPNSECAYTALPLSQDATIDIPMQETPPSRRRHSLSMLESLEGSISPPPGYKPPSHYTNFFGATQRRARSSSRRCRLLTAATVILTALYIFCYITFRPPNYIVLPPERYFDVLNATLTENISRQKAKDAVFEHLNHIRYPAPGLKADHTSIQKEPSSSSSPSNPLSLVPSTIWSSDGKPAPGAWATKWSQMGFDPKFLDDAAAEAWVEANFAGTHVKQMWDSLPRIILKADLLRYLLIFIEGGTWSDMDTVPLLPRQDWTKDAVPLSSILPEDSGIYGRSVNSSNFHHLNTEPVRAVIGIECDPNENASIRNFFERLRILPLRRHRNLQFVQWTIHAAPNHPIFLDVLRRVLQASDVYHAYSIDQERDANADGWGWGEREARNRLEQAKAREAGIRHPWDSISMSWKWQAGAWRWAWDILSVEEWTGPAVYTDSIISYLYASAGVRPEDLTLLKQPVQIRDVVIVPSYGFNPGSHKIEGKSRLVHLFRGSWKY